MARSTAFVGIDVSKRSLDVAVHPGTARFQLANDAAGHEALVQQLQALAPELVVLEPTGGYERMVLKRLLEAGLAARRVDPWRVRRYAEALGRRAKTDALDAEVLARFAEAVARHEPAAQEAAHPRLRALVEARAQLVEDEVRLGNQLAQAEDEQVRGWLTERLALLLRHKAELMALIRAVIDAEPELRLRAELLRSAPGVGEITALVLLAELPELGARDAKRIAALAGLAPRDRQSGTFRGRAAIKGGRAGVRRVLYMAALAACRTDARWKLWRHTLSAKGKPPKVCIVAVMRKLLVTLNAMLRCNQPFHTA